MEPLRAERSRLPPLNDPARRDLAKARLQPTAPALPRPDPPHATAATTPEPSYSSARVSPTMPMPRVLRDHLPERQLVL